MKWLACVLILSVYASSCWGALERYAVDSDIEAILDAHSHEIYKKIKKIDSTIQWHGVWQFDWLPGYYIKYGLERIKGVERIRRCIETYDLDCLTTPDKRVYHIKGRPYTQDNLNYAVVVKAIEPAGKQRPLTLEQVEQLCTIIHKADYVDMTSTNYIQMADGKLCLIDTEGIFNASKRIKGFLRMIGTRHDLNKNYTKDALKHIFWEIKEELRKHPENISFALPYLREQLEAQPQPHAWNYLSYAHEYFDDLGGLR